MKKEIKNLIFSHNNIEEGIYITYDLEKYVDKLIKNATIITYINEGVLKGFIAFYANNPNKNAYLSMILIDKKSQGENIGKLLLESSINNLKNKKFINYSLEVLKQNTKAINFYKNFGFKIKEDRNLLWLMSLDFS